MFLFYYLVVIVAVISSSAQSYLPIPLCDTTYLSENSYREMKKMIEKEVKYTKKEKKLRKKVLKKWRKESKEKDGIITVVEILKKHFFNLSEAQETGYGTFTFKANNKFYLGAIAKSRDMEVADSKADLDLQSSMIKNKKETIEKVGNTIIYSKFSSGTLSGYSPDKTIFTELLDGYLVIKIKEDK